MAKADDCNGHCIWANGKCLECGRDREPPVLGIKLDVLNEQLIQDTLNHANMEPVYQGEITPPTLVTPAAPQRKRLLETTSAERKQYPMAAGLLDYFPDALAEVARISYLGNQKHNPGQPMHHSRGKSMDHADCIMRHLAGRGGFDGDTRESAALAWRALALLQEELEKEFNLPLPRGAWVDP